MQGFGLGVVAPRAMQTGQVIKQPRHVRVFGSQRLLVDSEAASDNGSASA